ncbi:alpha-1,2-fucosyltransferase [Flavobacterium psychrophilum]
MSKKHNQDYCIPKWKYSDYFDFEFNVGYTDESFLEIKERKFEFHEWEISKGNFDLDGWLQSELYFDKVFVKNIFKFKDKFKDEVLLKNKHLFNKNCVIISVRRGDFVFNPSYYQLDFDYYLKALTNCFPDYKDKNLLFTSDDINYCKSLFQFLPNVYFLDEHSPIEQLIIASECENFIISNSTFSWWLAWFGEKENSKIIRPLKNFRGIYSNMNNDSDFFPERWLVFDDKLYDFPKGFNKIKIKGVFYFIRNYLNFNILRSIIFTKNKIKKIINN